MENKQIFDIIVKSNIVNLEKVLKNIKNDKQKEQIKNMFEKHMQEIAKYCIENFYNKDLLDEKFIKWLHLIHYPKWYIEKQKTISWDAEIVTMIPWNYKTLKNFDWVLVKDVKEEMNKLINNYNLSDKKEDDIYDFLLNFLRIHPFWNWNARVLSIIVDLMLIKNNYPELNFNLKQYKDKENIKNLIVEWIKERNHKEIIKKIKEL